MDPTPMATPTLGLAPRQLWATPTSVQHPPHCTAFNLPAHGEVVLNGTMTITLKSNALYVPRCTDLRIIGENGTLPFTDLQDPFIASTIPQIFVIGAMLVVACTLVIMLFITPRTSLGGGLEHLVSGGHRPSRLLGSGGRPLLQKLATLTVLIALFIAAVNSLQVAASQYDQGFEDAEALAVQVVGSTEIRAIRVVSDTFLWLAQVQTLIRLFPRRKEKIIIKWTGFALILLDTIFSVIDNFVVQESIAQWRRPFDFDNAIGVLWYFFQLLASAVYMFSVVYYSIVKRRFAYWHRRMRNICIVAFLALVSVAVPVVFFAVDIARTNVVGWGDYVRWTGAAAASVVVWEWVERIEALEREERKDGILGREIFEGDETSLRPWKNPRWPGRRPRTGGTDSRGGGSSGSGYSSSGSTAVSRGRPRLNFLRRLPNRLPQRPMRTNSASRSLDDVRYPPADDPHEGDPAPARMPMPMPMPRPIASPISRSDTNSAASTVFAVIPHPVAAPSAEPPATVAAAADHRSPDHGTSIHDSPAPADQPSGSSDPSPVSNASAPRAAELPLRSRLSRRFHRADNSDSPVSASAPSPVSTSDSVPPGFPPPLHSNSSRSRFRWRRDAPEPAIDLPTYVIWGGGEDGEGFVVEEQHSSASDVLPSPTSAGVSSTVPATGFFPAQPRYDSPPSAAHTAGAEYGVGAAADSHADSSQRGDAHSPQLPLHATTGPPHEPPPPFSHTSAASSSPVDPRAAQGSIPSPVSVPHSSASPPPRASTGSNRPSRRTTPNLPHLPVVVEGDQDGGPSEAASPSYDTVAASQPRIIGDGVIDSATPAPTAPPASDRNHEGAA